MKYITTILALIVVVSFNSCATHQKEFDFANKMAKEGLWHEAYFRWQKMLAKEPKNAALHNNIAIALEQMGKKEDAEKEYKQALKLAPENTFIKRNYDRFLSGDNLNDDEEKTEKNSKKKKGKKK